MDVSQAQKVKKSMCPYANWMADIPVPDQVTFSLSPYPSPHSYFTLTGISFLPQCGRDGKGTDMERYYTITFNIERDISFEELQVMATRSGCSEEYWVCPI